MVEQDRCPKCGTSLSPDAAPGQLCPRCLLSIVLEPGTDPGASSPAEGPEGTKSTELDAVESTQPGRVGPYRLARKLGEGGMGEVYEAEQTEPVRRKVALKLIKWGMDTRRVVARFEAERQALAMMDHPCIAKVFDAGATDQGRPYFAMELVKGVPINDYCDRHKLSTQQRLELFMRVCDGVQHAHQKGVIHRDIKPSNVLVTIQDDQPVPKIIDFGVAKATEQRLTEKTVFTELGQLVGTPEYMSPEQAEMTGLDIDTRTDVYSLGVLLYELLSGALPFEPRELRKAGYDEIRRRIREDEPAKPSTRISSLGEQATTAAHNRSTEPRALVRRLRGDLDWIAMRALEKDRTRRYGSPQELAADVARHLHSEPVLAGPPSTAYKMKKFVRRHRFGVAAAGVVALALVLGVIGTTVGMVRAVAAEEQAREEARRSEASKLVVLGERELERFPTGALAYAIKSLEVADTEAGRLLALRVLQNSPVARIVEVGLGEEDGGFALNLDFSPDGEWVATGGFTKSVVLHRDGQRRLLLGEYGAAGQGGFAVRFTPQSDALVADLRGDVRVWSIPEGRELRRGQIDRGFSTLVMGENDFLTITTTEGETALHSWPLGDGEPRLVGTIPPLGGRDWDATGGILAFGRDKKVFLQSIENLKATPRILTHEHGALEYPPAVKISDSRSMAISSDGTLVAVKEASGDIRIWKTASRSGTPLRVLGGHEDSRGLWFGQQSRWLAETGLENGRPTIWLWDLEAPRGSSPAILRRGQNVYMSAAAFDAQGRWLATAHANDVAFWWLGNDHPRVFHGSGDLSALVFTPDGRSLVCSSNDGTVRVWPVSTENPAEPRILFRGDLSSHPGIAIDPQGRRVAVAGAGGRIHVLPLAGGPATSLEGFSNRVEMGAVAFSPDGRLVAGAPFIGPAEDKVIRVYDLETGAVQVLEPVPGVVEGFGGVWTLRFAGRDRLIAGVVPGRNPVSTEVFHGIVSFDLATGDSSVVAPWPRVYEFLNNALTGGVGITAAGPLDPLERIRFRLDGSAPEPFHSRGQFWRAAFDPTDRLLATAGDDAIRIGPVSGAESHVLLGHEVCIDVVFSPDGRWLATACPDGTIRVIPVPDLTRPPLHTLPLDTLLAKLRTHTNVRAVIDPVEATGYTLEIGPFPGWAEPPEW